MSASRIAGSLGAMLFLVAAAGRPARAQTHFRVDVPHAAVPGFRNLGTFSSPLAGVAAGRLTFIKLLTNNPGTGASAPRFQVLRTAGQAAHIRPDEAVGVDNVISEPPLATLVASAIAVTAAGGDPCPAATVAPGYQMICILVQYDDAYDFTAGPETWQLNVEQHTTNDYEYFGWIGTVQTNQAAAETAVTKSKIQSTEPLAFGNVQRNIATTDAPVRAPVVRNIGTAPMTITAAAFSNDPAPAYFSRPVFAPGAVNPAATLTNNFATGEGLWIMARPTALGARESILTVSAGASDAATVQLSATGVTLFAHLLMDCSGSMRARPDASPTSTESETRLFLAKQPAKEINNWIKEFTGGEGYFGLTTLPQCPGNSELGQTRVPIDRSVNTQGSINLLLGPQGAGGLAPSGNTPIQSGIDTAIADMDARINGAAPPDPADRPNLRQAILLLTDGDQTTGDAAATKPNLINKGIRMYTVGYGTPTSGTVNHTLLQDLSSATGGEYWDANSLNAFALASAFKNAIRGWLDLQPIEDPTGTIRSGQSRNHDVCIGSDVYGLTFSVEWDRVAAGGISFTLESPTHEVITPSTSGIAYYSGDNFAQYIIKGSRVRAGAGAGVWTLRLAGGQAIPGNQDTRYSYSALGQSAVGVVPPHKFVTGLRDFIEVQLINWPVAARAQTVVNLKYDAPAASFGTYLATSRVQREWFFAPQTARKASAGFSLVNPLFAAQQRDTTPTRVPDTFMGEPATIVQRKAWALANIAKQPFDDKRIEGTLQMYDDGTHGDRVAGDAIYTVEAPARRFDGIYHYAYDIATPNLGRRECVDRDIRVVDVVSAFLTPAVIASNVVWHASLRPDLFFDPTFAQQLPKGEPPAGFTRSVVAFTPKDSLGNYWGPGRAREIQFAVRDAKPIGPVFDNWDGSYLQVLEHRTSTRPTIAVTAGGVTGNPVGATGGGGGMGGGMKKWVWLIIAAIVIIVLLLIWKPWARRA